MTLQYWLAAQQWFGLGIAHLEALLLQFDDISGLFTCDSQQLAELNLSLALIAAREAIDWKMARCQAPIQKIFQNNKVKIVFFYAR